jgi:hypothetical protein
MPGAKLARSFAWNKENHTKVVTTGPPDDSSIPCANGFNGFLRALLGEPGLLSPSLARSSSHRLNPSVGGSGPHDFAVRFQVARLAPQQRPPHPVPNVRDDRETPLFIEHGMRWNLPVIWGRHQCWLPATNWHDGQISRR